MCCSEAACIGYVSLLFFDPLSIFMLANIMLYSYVLLSACRMRFARNLDSYDTDLAKVVQRSAVQRFSVRQDSYFGSFIFYLQG